MSVVNVTNRAQTPEEAAAMCADDLSDYMERQGLTKDDVMLTASCVAIGMEYVYSILVTYNEQRQMIQNVPHHRATRETRRLRQPWAVRELEPYNATIDRDLITSFLGCPKELLSYVVATFYGVFEGQRLVLISNSWDAAVAVANRANTEGSCYD